MADVSIKIENIDAIRSAFRKAPEKMTKELDKAIKKAILKVESGAVREVPVIAGFLRDSRTLEFGSLTGSLWFRAYYAVFVHEGTRFQRAQPFLRNAVEAENGSIQTYFKQAVEAVLESIARDSRS